MARRIALIQGHPDPDNILEFCGIAPVRSTMIGTVEGAPESREDWLQRLGVLGVRGR